MLSVGSTTETVAARADPSRSSSTTSPAAYGGVYESTVPPNLLEARDRTVLGFRGLGNLDSEPLKISQPREERSVSGIDLDALLDLLQRFGRTLLRDDAVREQVEGLESALPRRIAVEQVARELVEGRLPPDAFAGSG